MENLMLRNGAILSFIILMSVSYLLLAPMASIDPFHTGEYFVKAVNIEHGLNSFTIHGMVDYLPALITKYVFGQNYITPTIFTIRFISLFSSFMLTLICYQLLRKHPSKIYILLMIFTLSLAIISHRDLFILMSIYFFIKIVYSHSNSQLISNFHHIFFSFTMALALFWTFDRGISAIVAIGPAYLYYIIQSKQYNLMKSIYAFLFFILLLNFTFDASSIEHYVNNVLSLVKSSNQWQYGNYFMPNALIFFATCLLVFTILNLAKSIQLNKNHRDRAFLILLLILSLFIFKSSINRADVGHVMINVLPIMLLISFRLGKDEKITFIPLFCNQKYSSLLFFCFLVIYTLGFAPKSLSIILLSLLLIFITVEKYKSIFNKMVVVILIVLCVYQLRTSLMYVTRYSTDRLVSEGNNWVSEILIKNNTKCIFDLTNNGIINALSNLPTCTLYGYPIYAPYEDEHLLLQQLIANQPNTLIYSSSFGSYSIDGKSMSVRYPAIDDFIKENYEYFICKFDYCIMSSVK